MRPERQRPEPEISKYWWLWTSSPPRRPDGRLQWFLSKEEYEVAVLLHGTALVSALSIFGVLVLLLDFLGLARHGSPLLFIAAIGLGLGYWIARPIWDWLKPTLMKKADQNAARRFNENRS